MEILIKPIITEKSSLQNEKGIYTFQVALKANKIQIKQAVEEMYGVNVADVRTMIVPGKRKIRYTKRGFATGRTPKYKKAIVQLAEGEVIDFYGDQ
ncbi:MAG: 50S ribosomal protein L23 [Cytophagales bacterium]|nr:50S ribosomal protein L23 [Bernardetiaceae bacterium]MDW8209943.1 50S ribosomal protein L23 [Cytophagales bacterium]